MPDPDPGDGGRVTVVDTIDPSAGDGTEKPPARVQ
jgi:glutaminase